MCFQFCVCFRRKQGGEGFSILNTKNNSTRYDILPYHPHPVISRLKDCQRPNVNQKLPDAENMDQDGNDDKFPHTTGTGAYPTSLFSDIIERLDTYYEQKMSIEVDKLKLFFEKEKLNILKGQQKCCCVQQDDKRIQELQLALVSLNQFNMNLQKKNDELTNQILTIIMHVKNQDLNNKETVSSVDKQKPRPSSEIRKSTTKKSFMCCLM